LSEDITEVSDEAEEIDSPLPWATFRDAEADEVERICIWCGKVCDSVEALDAHEADCEP
jgi:hypothetical protein